MYEIITHQDGSTSIVKKSQNVSVSVVIDDNPIVSVEDSQNIPDTSIGLVMQSAVDKLSQKVDNESKEPIEPVTEDSK